VGPRYAISRNIFLLVKKRCSGDANVFQRNKKNATWGIDPTEQKNWYNLVREFFFKKKITAVDELIFFKK
jgi:hypothetical protein